MVSCLWSPWGLLDGERKHWVQWIDIHLGWVGRPRYLPRGGGQVWHSLLQISLNLLHHFVSHAMLCCKASAMRLGRALWVSDGLWHFLSAPHGHVLWMWPSWGGRFYSWGSLCKGGWVNDVLGIQYTSPEWGMTMELFSFISHAVPGS